MKIAQKEKLINSKSLHALIDSMYSDYCLVMCNLSTRLLGEAVIELNKLKVKQCDELIRLTHKRATSVRKSSGGVRSKHKKGTKRPSRGG